MVVRFGLKILSWGKLLTITRLTEWCQTAILCDGIFNSNWAERLALPTSDHGVTGSNPAGGEILPEPKRRFIAQSLSCSPFHRLEMTEILLKGRKTLTHPSIQFKLNNHYRFFFLHTLSSTIAFRLEYVLFDQFYAKITTFFDQETFSSAPFLYVDIGMFGGNWCENDAKTSKMMLKSSYWHHAWVVLHPSCKMTFLAPVGFTEIPVGYARKNTF